MPVFAWIGSVVAGWFFAAGTAAFIATSWLVSTAAAFVTSRIINGNPNKGNNAAQGSQGGRIQVPPATNNKVPVVYGSAYVNGTITDARLISTDQKKNDTMYYCIVLSETSNNIIVDAGNFIVGQKYTISTVGTTNFTLIGAASNTVGVKFTATGVGSGTGQARYNPVYGLEGAYWNDLRLTAVDSTTNAHKVKDGRKVVDGNIVTAGAFVTGSTYIIKSIGNTNFTLIGAPTNNLGQIFTATGPGTGTGTAQEEDWIDKNFIVDGNSLVELRVYAGSSSAANQIYPPQSSLNTTPAYTMWGGNDGSWDATYSMTGLVFAIVKVTYDGAKGFTGLPNMTFQLANNVANPADVWLDYMTSQRYGAGIDPIYIDETARLEWYNFCEEDINYTNAAGNTNQSTLRYNINGVIDTNNQVKTNIDTVLQNGGAWMSYDVSTGLWRPIIKKAITAGDATEVGTHFTASRAGTTLTVTNFEEGRIETGQYLYNSSGTYIGTITGQLTATTVTAGSFVVGQTYTIVSIGSTNFTLIGASANTVGLSFTATGVGSGSGTAITSGETAGQVGRYTTDTTGVIASTTFFTTAPNLLQFSDDNIISGINLSSTRLDDLYNQLEVEFYDKYNKDQKAYYRSDLPEIQRNPNEPDNQLRMSLDLVNNSMQADILGQVELRQSRDDLVIEFTANHYGIQAQAGDIVAVTSDLYGWAPKLFRVMRVKEQETEDGGLVAQIQGLEYNGDVYTIEPITEFTTEANIGIGVYGTSPNMPQPPRLAIVKINGTDPIPNFQLQVRIPTDGGPYDEIEFYVTEGWDEMTVVGSITAGTLTVTSTPFGSMGQGDIFKNVGAYTNVSITEQLTNNPVSKNYLSGGTGPGTIVSPTTPVNTVTLNNTTGLLIGNTLIGTGLPATGAHITAISGSQVTLDTFFTAQAAGTYTVFGGLGTYTVDQNITTAVNNSLFDLPLSSDYYFFKKITPSGNTATFTNGETITVTVTELPANTQTYRRWYIIARMGIKKRFGAFSEPSTLDKDGNFQYEPDPAAGSVSVLNIQQALVKLDFGNLVIPNNGFLLFRTLNPVDFGNDNNIGSSAQLDLGLLSVVENTVTSATTDVETFVWQIDPT